MPAEIPKVIHSYLDQVYPYQPDMTDQDIDNPEVEWFTDGSSCKDGLRRAEHHRGENFVQPRRPNSNPSLNPRGRKNYKRIHRL